MNSLLDVIGSFVIGAILIIAIMNAVFSIQANSVDLQQQIVLTEISENITSILTEYLSKVGAGVPSSSAILSDTGSKIFSFVARDSSTVSSIRTFQIIQSDSVANRGFPLRVYIDGNLEMGPFWLSDELKLIYYDQNNDLIPIDNGLVVSGYHSQIRSIKVELDFFYDAFLTDKSKVSNIDSSKIRNEVVIWKYFLNMYL